MAGSDRSGREAMRPPRHVGSGIALLVTAAVVGLLSLSATGELLWCQGDDLAVENVSTAQAIYRGIALVLLAGGLSLLTRTSLGLWLGRLAAGLLVLVGAYLVLWVVFFDESYLKALSIITIGPIAALLAGGGIAILVVLRARSSA